MHKISVVILAAGFFGTICSASIRPASAQSRTVPAGDSLAQTPPVDQRAKQYNALPEDQKPVVDGQVVTSPPPVPNAGNGIPPR